MDGWIHSTQKEVHRAIVFRPLPAKAQCYVTNSEEKQRREIHYLRSE